MRRACLAILFMALCACSERKECEREKEKARDRAPEGWRVQTNGHEWSFVTPYGTRFFEPDRQSAIDAAWELKEFKERNHGPWLDVDPHEKQ